VDNTFVVIMAGGKGERFWPLSTEDVPKPFINVMGESSLIQLTVERAMKIIPVSRICIVLGKKHLAIARKQLPALSLENFIIEPEGRDTAPCIGLAAMTVRNRNNKAIMVILPADHYVPDVAGFVRTIKAGINVAKKGDYLVTVGIKPVRPETGYGYVCLSDPVAPDRPLRGYRIEKFVEKPDLKRARKYYKDDRYYWNGGIFIWQAGSVLNAIEKYMPDMYGSLVDIGKNIGKKAAVDRIFRSLTRISIDYGIMQQADNVMMVPADFAWDDIGTWSSLSRVLKADDNGNCVSGDFVGIDTKNCVIQGKNIKIGTIGISDCAIIATPEGLLVCDINRVQEVREIAKKFSEKP
jgi:mannose-1-phosphate guanylyltransferase